MLACLLANQYISLNIINIIKVIVCKVILYSNNKQISIKIDKANDE